jgi:hypothetical protein
MRSSITNLIILEETKNLVPVAAEDRKVIIEHLNEQVDIWYDEDLKVYNEAGTYIADLKEAGELA